MQNAQHRLPKGYIPDGAIDFDALTRLTHFYIEAGAAGLFANCLSSEMFELTDDERLAITKCTIEAAQGRVPVVATGTFEGTIAQQADFVKQIYDTGVQAVIVITGLIAKPEEADTVLMERLHELMHLTPAVPLGLYECPVPYKRLITATDLGELVSTGRVIYHKDTSLDIEQVKAKLKATSGHNFGLYDAYMPHAVDSLRAGSAGLSCIQGNFFPELISWLCQHFDDPAHQEKVGRIQQLLIDTMDVIHTAYPTVSKYYLQKRGLPISLYTRRKVEPFTEEVRKSVDDLMDKVQKI